MSNAVNGLFSTSDTPLAAFLYASGVRLIELDRSNPQRIAFVFDPPDAELLASWQKATATINVRAFWSALQELKARLTRDE